MELKTKRNDWHMHLESIYGGNGLHSFTTREELADFLTDEDFFDNVMPDGVSDDGETTLAKIAQEFINSNHGHTWLEEQVLTVVEANKGELHSIYIEDFESLCTGKTDFGEMAIHAFCDANDEDPRMTDRALTSISPTMKPEFLDFFDRAYELWIG